MRQSARLSVARHAFGLPLASHVDLGTSKNRRRVAVSHEIYGNGGIPELRLAQRKHFQQRGAQNFFIDAFVRPGVSGFQCVQKLNPQDYFVQEIVGGAPVLPRVRADSERTRPLIEETTIRAFCQMAEQHRKECALRHNIGNQNTLIDWMRGKPSSAGSRRPFDRVFVVPTRRTEVEKDAVLQAIALNSHPEVVAQHPWLLCVAACAGLHRYGVEAVYSEPLFFLNECLGPSGAALVRRSFTGVLRHMLRGRGEYNAAAFNVSVAWNHEQLLRISRSTGAIFSSVKGKWTDRHAQEGAQVAVARLWSQLRSGVHGVCNVDPPILHVVGTADRLCVLFSMPHTVPSDAITTACSRGEALASQGPPHVGPNLPSQLQVVEFVLEKHGFPHDEAISEIAEAVADAAVDEWPTLAECRRAMPTKVTFAGVIERAAFSYQRVRIRGTHWSHVTAVAQRLEGRGVPWPEDEVAGAAKWLPAELSSLKPDSFVDGARVYHCYLQGESSKGRRIGDVLNGFNRQDHRAQSLVRLNGSSEDEFLADPHNSPFYRIHDVKVVATEDIFFESTPTDTPKEVTQRFVAAREKAFHSLAHCDLKLGQDHEGCRYRITLRHVLNAERPKVLAASQSLLKYGFLNYFAPSRFGLFTGKELHPGLHLLKGEYRAAANAMLDCGEHFGYREMPSSSLQLQDRRGRALGLALKQDSKDGGGSDESCRTAFVSQFGVPKCRSLINEFLYAMWNDVVTRRVRRHGPFCVLEGDIVRLRANKCNALLAPNEMPIFVSADDLRAGRYTPFDVMIPIPGNGICLPHNDTAALMIHLLEGVGLPLDPVAQEWPAFRAAKDDRPCSDTPGIGIGVVGGYRYMLERPLDWQAPVIRNDEAASKELRGPSVPWVECTNLQVQLQFTLPPSVFPAMLVRELCKWDHNTPHELHWDVQPEVTWERMSEKDRKIYQRFIQPQRRRMFMTAKSLRVAELQNRIFHSGGRRSIIPSLRSLDSVG